MCVPTSGTLELEELAREAYYGQHGGGRHYSIPYRLIQFIYMI